MLGGASITPAARKSIHSHNHCIFSHSSGMGRYGLKDVRDGTTYEFNTTSCAKGDEGVDEVDNVMSKFSKPSSPLRVNNKSPPRRNSLSFETRLDPAVSDDESDISYVLAKSLPATLPSHYSGEFGNWSVHSDVNNHSWNQRIPENTRNTYSHEDNSPRIPTPKDGQEKSQNGKKSSKSVLFFPAAALITILATLYSDLLVKSQQRNSIIYDESGFHTDLSDLGRKYKVTDNTILQVQTGISTIYKRQDAGSFVFAYNSNSDQYDPVQFNKFMNEIAASTARYLRNDSKSVTHIVLDSSAFDMESHSELINKYKDDIDKSGVMLVKELDMVPSKLAMAFHYYCDEYNPLVKRSAIFFTLNMAKCTETTSGLTSIFSQIEKCLKKKWNGGVPQDNIGPLLTRVVASVVDITRI
ncbi:uncharacterized protein TORIP isoform X3 [Plodia interpunctella]|uniref:uncharacterized protein TORIP isoform X3 n=1 Tax=Plodia interpunctella TaxID=58824 RepID=UPI002367D36E|nr:uncharacterized protein LOC128669839 isoform X3 [Plodia interpunctella]